MAKFTANAYNPRNREFIPMDDLLESQEFDRLTNATKIPLYQQKIENDRVYYEQSKWNSIICKDQEINSVGPNYDLIQHQEAFISVINTLNKAGIKMKGRINDFGNGGTSSQSLLHAAYAFGEVLPYLFSSRRSMQFQNLFYNRVFPAGNQFHLPS